jgi:hypothetical protein
MDRDGYSGPNQFETHTFLRWVIEKVGGIKVRRVFKKIRPEPGGDRHRRVAIALAALPAPLRLRERKQVDGGDGCLETIRGLIRDKNYSYFFIITIVLGVNLVKTDAISPYFTFLRPSLIPRRHSPMASNSSFSFFSPRA